jgi:hypothetical protein
MEPSPYRFCQFTPAQYHASTLFGWDKQERLDTPGFRNVKKKYLDFRQYAVAEDGGKDGNGQESVEGLLGLGRA